MTVIKRKTFEENLDQEVPANSTQAYLNANFADRETKVIKTTPQPSSVQAPQSSYHNVAIEKPEKKKMGKLPYTEPWEKVGMVMSKEHNRKFKELVQRIRRSGNPDYNQRKGLEQALDLLFNLHEVK